MSEGGRPLRADARRNRARILEAAFEAFASDGLSVPVQEIARRAGVGTGTVSRHFPTKESLFEAILLSRAGRLVDEAARLARSDDPGAAFFEFFSLVVAEGTANLGMAEALAGLGFDLETNAKRGGLDVMGALNDLLARAKRAGAIRADADAMDVKALITGCLARTPGTADLATRDRMISIARQGLRNALPCRASSPCIDSRGCTCPRSVPGSVPHPQVSTRDRKELMMIPRIGSVAVTAAAALAPGTQPVEETLNRQLAGSRSRRHARCRRASAGTRPPRPASLLPRLAAGLLSNSVTSQRVVGPVFHRVVGAV